MQLRRHTPASRIVCAMAVCLALLGGQASAAPGDVTSPSVGEQSVDVRVTQATPSVTSQGTMRVAVEVTLAAPAEYVEVRLRLRNNGGRLLYQKTEVRSGQSSGMHLVEYEFDLRELDLTQDRYPIEIRVLATGSEATNVVDRLLVTDPAQDALPVAVVVRTTATPAVTTDGLFAIDPAEETRLQDALTFVTQLALDRRIPISLVLPAVLTEQLGRAEAGYETTAGLTVPASADEPVRTAHLLDALSSALATGTVELIDSPYALPDAGQLHALSADSDFAAHWQRTDAVNAAVLRLGSAPTVAYLGETLTAEALESLASRDADCVLAPPSAIRSDETTTSPGCYQLPDTDLRVLVLDTEAAISAREGAGEFYDTLFKRIDSGGPVVIMLEVGSGDPHASQTVLNVLDWIEEAPWMHTTSLESLSRHGTEDGVELAAGRPDTGAYWDDIARGRELGMAYVSAAGLEDADAMAVQRAVLISESSLFAAARSSRTTDAAMAYDGRAFATQLNEFVTTQFGLIRLDAKDVTLSGTTGDVPLTLINDTGKPLELTLLASSAAVSADASLQDLTIQPTQNFLTVPIDLGNVLSETVRVEVRAGNVTVTEATVEVRASYTDRLAIIGMVVLVLGGLLVFIRRRALASDAATIVANENKHDPQS